MATRKRKPKVEKHQYLATDDIWEWQRHNSTHRSMSEAFRDAEYACAIHTFKADWKLTIDYLCGVLYGMFSTGMMLLIPILIVMWLTR